MPCKKTFTDFVKIENVREGKKVDGKLINVYFDLVVGPFSIQGVSFMWKTGSILMPRARQAKIKGSYVATLRKAITEAITEKRNAHRSKQAMEIGKHGGNEQQPATQAE